VKRIKAILAVTLTVFAFLAVLAGINVTNPVANPKWRPLGPLGLTFPLLRVGSTLVYDPTSNRIILFAGSSADDASQNPRLNDVWILTNANGFGGRGTWSQLFPQGGPPHVRERHSAVYDALNDRMIIYGGCGAPFPPSEGCLPIADDVWVLDHASGVNGTPTWIQLSPTGHPNPRQGHQAVYDPNTNSMIVWAGQDGGGTCSPGVYSDVWVLSHANGLGGTPNWTRLLPTGGPPAGRYFSTAVYDSSNNILIVFGGISETQNCQSTNAVWALSHANGIGGTPVWRNLIAQDADGSPANRAHQAAVYDPGTNTMTIFGGDNTGAFFGDTWVLSNANGIGPADPVWNLLTDATGPVPSSRWNGGVIDTRSHRMIMFGGSGDGQSGISSSLWTTWIMRPSIGPPRK
jgi:hypothetical protein